MTQVAASIEKTFKEFLRDKMVIFWTFAIPLFFVIMFPLILYGGIPKEEASSLKGSLTLTMITFLLMTAGQANLPGSIATDKERGLYLKLASMPVQPWKEGLSRVFAVWIFSLIGGILVLLTGIIYGATFRSGFIASLESAGFILLISFATVGIGLIIASVVKGESAATHTGIALTLLTYFLGGMGLPYSNLPSALQTFARIYPLPSANASMIFLLEGEEFVGYNPLNIGQMTLMISLSLLLFIIGVVFYSKYCWKKR